MTCPEIVATIGLPFDDKSIKLRIANCINNGIKSFRFNFAKSSIEEIEQLIINISNNKLLDDCDIMLDFPFPGKKTRISFKDNSLSKNFNTGDIIAITGKRDFVGQITTELILVDNESIHKVVSVGQELIYSDGDCILTVLEIDYNSGFVVARISNSVKMYTKKSLSYNHVITTKIDQKYVDLINRVKPSSVAFSFITDAESLFTCTKDIYDKNIEIVSKIETADSISNAEEIAVSSSLMLGRGDLILNSEPYKLYEYQSEISELTKRLNQKLYIATGILTSLSEQPIPTQAELIDLYNIMLCKPDAIILNGLLVAGDNLEYAVKLIRKTAASIYGD